MKIVSIQKTTLIDFPDRIACTLFFYGCNFRCGFCHNPELVIQKPEMKISEEEVFNFLNKRKDYLEGVCITGGEPLATLETEFLEKIKKIGYLIKIDTNGSFPEKLKEIIEKGLVDFIAMDIKSSKDNYNKITNSLVNLIDIEKSIKLIANSGIDYEFRTTIVDLFHDEEEIERIGKWLNNILGRKPKKFALQGFKNNGKFIDENFKKMKDTSSEKLKKLKTASEKYFEKIEIRE